MLCYVESLTKIEVPVTNTHPLNRSLSTVLSILLFLCTPIALWGTTDVEVSTANNVIEVRGSNRAPWKLRYGIAGLTSSDKVDETHLAKDGPGRAYFSHGQCLRWIDTDRGMVLGRWLMPGIITRIIPQEGSGRAEITVEEPYPGRESFISTFTFGPLRPQVYAAASHDLTAENLLPEREATKLYGAVALQADRAHALLQEVQEAVRRDPFSPWFRVILGKLLLEAREPGAEAAFEQAIQPLTSYMELLPISGFLENLQVGRIADEAFQRGYRDFLQNGNDPRLLTSIVARLWLYPVGWEKLSPDRRAKIAERIYQLMPYGEAADLAWQEYALSAATPEEHKLWLNRAEEARKDSGHLFAPLVFQFDVALLVNIACVCAWWAFVVVSYIRYRLQRRHDRTAVQPRPLGLRKRLAFFNVQYWSMPQRIGFVSIFLVSWFCYGWMGQSLAPPMLMGEAPMGMVSGSLASLSNRLFLQTRLSATPERDFLMALSSQQGGDYTAAIRLYQQAPQYAESWNNLGVIWRMQGRETDAVGAFHRALQLNSALGEAAFNMGLATSDYWAQIHRQYVPNAPMVAPPSRRVWLNAFAGGPPSRRLALASLGPLHPWHWNMNSMAVTSGAAKAGSVVWLLSEIALGLTVLLFIFPSLPVQQPAGMGGKILGIVFPGTAREWSYASGLALMAWIFLMLQLFMTKRFGSPYILTFIGTPNLVRAYGAGTSPEQAISLINPGWGWLYLAPAMLALINLMICFPTLRAKMSLGFRQRKEHSSSSETLG
jgi:tetratricopeptide (TPR) repeat protein